MPEGTLLDRMAFTGTWRDYQQRVLDEFARHATDRVEALRGETFYFQC